MTDACKTPSFSPTPIKNNHSNSNKDDDEVFVAQPTETTALADRYESIIKRTTRGSRPTTPSRLPVSSPIKYADESADNSPSDGNRPQLVQRLSASEFLSSSPESLGAPESRSKLPRSASHECLRRDNDESEDSNNEQSALDSLLAKQALLAAKVLHLIPVEQARDRNYLQRRVTASALLGASELDRVLPGRNVSVFVGTWNMNGQAPPIELNDLLLPEDLDHVHDIVAIGTQESYPERFEWEVKLQETIGPTHVLLHSISLGTLHLAVFLRRDLLWFCSVPEDDSLSVRPGTAFRTKGAVAICFLLFGTSYLFISSHLTAHQDKVKERVSDVKRIVRSLELPKNLPIKSGVNRKDITKNFDCVFWCGDLNFRLSETRENVIQWAESNPLKVDLLSDQLKKLMFEGTCLTSFEEGEIKFAPTYKFDPGTQNYDTSHKQRTPSYTDRILYRYSPSHNHIECKAYSSVMSITTSDHKPVWGVFTTRVRPGIDTIPLAAGLFNRDVYLEGIKRRVAELQRQELGLSLVCSVQ